MRQEVYPAYLQSSVAGYADDNVAAGRWPAQGCVERSLAEFESLLPQGLATPNHHLFEILAAEGGPTVGFVWLAVEERHGIRGAFVYDVEVKPAYRRQGHAQRAFEQLETLAMSLELSTIGLHVFGHNPGAQALYAKLGYRVTGINMQKQVSATEGHS
jgi:ribosomal protein S18 acetylase RimI-like enzyme